METWVRHDGAVFARSRLDLKTLTDNLTKMEELPTEVRNYVRDNAERVHMDLEREEAKRAGMH